MTKPSPLRVAFVAVSTALVLAIAVVGSALATRAIHLEAAAAEVAGSAAALTIEIGGLALLLDRARLERRAVGLTLERRDIARFLTGGALGVALVVATFGLAVTFAGGRITVATRSQWPHPETFFAQLGTFALRCTFEETVFRAGLVGVLALAFGRATSLGVPALLFAAAHAWNPGASVASVANTALAALVLGALFLFPQRAAGAAPSLAAPTGFHLAWNFSLAAVLGVTVSGGSGARAHFLAVSIPADRWSGGAYGIEASPATTATFGIAAAVLGALLCRRAAAFSAGDEAHRE